MRSATTHGLSVLGCVPMLWLVVSVAGCTVHHSKQALWAAPTEPPSPNAVFVSEEDSGLSLLGLFVLSEPDHYAVLLDRAKRRHRCAKLNHAQLDFYTDHWLIVAFPIARITVVCERPAEAAAAETAQGASSNPAPSVAVSPALAPPPATPE